MLLVIFMIMGKVIAKKTELGDEPDYYPKVNPNPNHIDELTISDIPIYFDMFNRFYEIDYKNDEHLNNSFEIFTDNLKRIIIMNKFSTASKFAINEFSHISLEEFTEKYTGFNDTEMDENDVNAFSYNSTEGAPKNLDWRTLGLPPQVRHQGPCKSSYVFSAVANIEAQVAKNFKKIMRLSEQQAYDCEPTGTCKYGGLPHKVMESIMNIGGLEEQVNYVYDPEDHRECKIKPNLLVVEVKSIQRVKPLSENGLIALLALYGPIVTTIFVSESVKNYYSGVLWPTDCDRTPNHAVLLVGYGVTADSIPFWIIKNSWGMLWGEAGYIRLIRGEHACNIGQYVATATVEMIDRSNITKLTDELSPFQHNVSIAMSSSKAPLTTKTPSSPSTSSTETTSPATTTPDSVDDDKTEDVDVPSKSRLKGDDLARKENLNKKIIASELSQHEAEDNDDRISKDNHEDGNLDVDGNFKNIKIKKHKRIRKDKQRAVTPSSSSSESPEETASKYVLKAKNYKIQKLKSAKTQDTDEVTSTEKENNDAADSDSEVFHDDDDDSDTDDIGITRMIRL